jgi:hypothetical protein
MDFQFLERSNNLFSLPMEIQTEIIRKFDVGLEKAPPYSSPISLHPKTQRKIEWNGGETFFYNYIATNPAFKKFKTTTSNKNFKPVFSNSLVYHTSGLMPFDNFSPAFISL